MLSKKLDCQNLIEKRIALRNEVLVLMKKNEYEKALKKYKEAESVEKEMIDCKECK